MINIHTQSFAEAHRELITALMSAREIPTDYDAEGEKPSLDAPGMIQVSSPWSPPVFSKCVFADAGGAFDYVSEVVDGTHDHLVGQLGYTYHDRLAGQWAMQLTELRRFPSTRRAQSVTWRWKEDLGAAHPPCLQIVHTRIVAGKLEMLTHWRSRDAWKAWGLNVFALAHLQRKWAAILGVEVGAYMETCASYHVYGRDRTAAAGAIKRPADKWAWEYADMLKGGVAG